MIHEAGAPNKSAVPLLFAEGPQCFNCSIVGGEHSFGNLATLDMLLSALACRGPIVLRPQIALGLPVRECQDSQSVNDP